MHDLTPATRTLSNLVLSLDDRDLDRPTPNPGMDVRLLVAHVHGLAQAFAAAGRQDLGPLTDTPPAEAELVAGWREEVPAELALLASSWSSPEAWQGFTRAGGVDMPAEVAGQVALDEVLMHGWDLAVALGTPFEVADDDVEAVLPFLEASRDPADREGLFGPVVEVADDAPTLHRALGLAGRDPSLTP